jgi:DNA invertase Pin-like site-specific DNA recombinase
MIGYVTKCDVPGRHYRGCHAIGRLGDSMQIGYMRVSKADGSQSTDLQRDALRAAGVAARRLYEDRASGRLDARPGLDAALESPRRRDTLIVWKLERLGRALRHLISVVHDLST